MILAILLALAIGIPVGQALRGHEKPVKVPDAQEQTKAFVQKDVKPVDTLPKGE